MEDVSTVPLLTAELLHRGYQDDEIGGILGLNVIRVLERCEEVAKELQATTRASDARRSVLDKDVLDVSTSVAAAEEGEPAAKKAKSG